MGIINNLLDKGVALDSGYGRPRTQRDPQGQNRWRQIFGAIHKEEQSTSPQVRPTPGGSWSRSSIANPEATKRLLLAMRSLAPGGWSDDRWEQTKHYSGAPYVAIDRISKLMGQSEYQIYVKDSKHPDGKRPVTPEDPPHGDRLQRPYDLVELLEKPNNYDSWGLLMKRWSQQMRLTGTALTWMVPNQLGTPMELYCIPTAIAIPQPAINPDYPDGYYRIQPVYPYGPFSSYPTPATAVGAPIPAQWMMRFQYPHPLLRYDGFSPLTGLRREIDQLESINKSRWYKMQRTFSPDVVLNFDSRGDEVPAPLPREEIDRIRSEIENEQQGPENVGRLFVSTPGARLEEFGKSNKDMDYPEGWEQMVSFILGGGFGITKPAAGMVEGATYANLYATLRQLYLLTLEPDCDDIAGFLTRHLAPFFGDDLIVEIRCKRIDDHDIIFQKINVCMTAKCITKNQVLKLCDLPVTREPWGEEIAGIDPQQMQQMQQQAAPMQQGAPAPTLPGSQVAPQAPQQNGTAPQTNGDQPLPPYQEPEITKNKPVPGDLGVGSLGRHSKKALLKGKRFRKSFYHQVRKVIANGHH